MSPSTSSSTKAPLPEPRPLRALPRQSTAGTLLLLSALLLAFFPSQFISASRLPFDLVRQSSILWAQPRPRPSPSPDGAMSTSSATTAAAAAAAPAGGWFQTTFTLPPRARGSYLVTSHVESTLGSEIAKYRVGILHLFVQHTSCALSLNENWDDDVRADMSDALDRIVPEAGKASGVSYRHSAEGRDDMPVGPPPPPPLLPPRRAISSLPVAAWHSRSWGRCDGLPSVPLARTVHHTDGRPLPSASATTLDDGFGSIAVEH